ncbi:MAG TPA: group 1 truncated hemoglobin [Acetobacteraceae bacterium]|nr:group 1 truncated hemoglobin [Acetobacteraceae bacterium]
MKNISRIFAATALTLTAGLISLSSARADSSYYQEFGGHAGMTNVVNAFVGHVAADPRINYYFAHANIPRLKASLVAQFCQLEGGPCVYHGPSMAAAHKGMGVTQAAFNALAEDLMKGMDDENVPPAAQNNLLAQLAAMAPEINSK